jgi:hypothetical protein
MSQSLASFSESLTRESIDCVEGTRKRGGTFSSRRGEGIFGLLRSRVVSTGVSRGFSLHACYLLCTQNVKFANVSSLCARWSYSTNFIMSVVFGCRERRDKHCSSCATLHRDSRSPWEASTSKTTETAPTSFRPWCSRRPARPAGSCGDWGSPETLLSPSCPSLLNSRQRQRSGR